MLKTLKDLKINLYNCSFFVKLNKLIHVCWHNLNIAPSRICRSHTTEDVVAVVVVLTGSSSNKCLCRFISLINTTFE